MSTPNEVLERRAEQTEAMTKLGVNYAYEMATGLLDGHCLNADTEDFGDWIDLDSVDTEEAAMVQEAVDYLDWRGCIDRHETMPRWVSVRDESEAR